jgi:carbon-monoxide dehydrogenase medium subunit
MISLKTVIDLQKIQGLDEISFEQGKGLTIGATARLADVGSHPVLRERYPAIAEAALATANVQIRHMGTVAGNLCNAAPSAENAPTLMAMGAQVTLVSPKGQRQMSLDRFFKGPQLTEIQQGEVLTAIHVPVPPEGSGAAYLHISARGKVDISAVCVGVQVTMKGETCQETRIILGAVAPTPMRAIKAEKVVTGNPITEALLQNAGLEASKECAPITDMRATAEYRRMMVAVLTARAIDESRKRALKQ